MAGNLSQDELLILKDHAGYVEEHGLFPLRQEFQVKHRSRIAAFDSLESKGLLERSQKEQFTLWTIEGLRELSQDVPFAAASLARGRRLLEVLQDLFADEGQTRHSVQKLAANLDADLNDEPPRKSQRLGYLNPTTIAGFVSFS